MENTENHNEKQSKNSETFSYSWYPTQCDMNKAATATSSGSLSQEPYRVMKTNEDEELIVVEQKAPEQASPKTSQIVINIGNKFTDQQVKVLMKSWKELCDKRQHIRTCESDWHDITDKVNMAPGTAKTVKQVKKKFKNLRDRYRSFKIKNKRRNFGFSKTLSFSQFEQVYGEIDCRVDRPSHTNINALHTGIDQGGAASNKFAKTYSEEHSQIGKNLSTSENNVTCRNSLHPEDKLIPRQTLTEQMLLTSNDIISEHSNRSNVPRNVHPQSQRRVSSSNENEYRIGTTSPRVATSHGGRQMPNNEAGQFDSGLVNAVRELQQQQITMQREIMRNMKQMEERLMQEISSRIHESEERFRQQIANALTQLGNLMRIV